MPDVLAATEFPWRSGTSVYGAALDMPWGSGTSIYSIGGVYTPGPPPGEVTTTDPTPLRAGLRIDARSAYLQSHTMTVVDQRDDAVLPVTDVTINTDEDSVFWSLRMTGPDALYAALSAGEQPAAVLVTIDGMTWQFVVDSVGRSRSFGSASTTVSGRSITAAAGSPFEVEQSWINEGPTSAAQIAAISNTYTGLAVAWGIEDWLVPDRVWSFTGTPLAAVKRVADNVGAVVQSHRTEYELIVRPRYTTLWNEWPVTAPNVEIALAAVVSEGFERADRPAYNAVYLSGQQQGAVGYVTMAGSSGTVLHPLITDLLLTDEPALRMRGMAVLGTSGDQANVTLVLPVLTGTDEPGVLDVGMICKILDPAGDWYGRVRSVSMSARMPDVTQSVTLERHTSYIDGTVVDICQPDPLVFTGPIGAQSVNVGSAFTLALAPYWSGGTPPYTWSMRSGTLPAGLTLNSATGVISGTPTGPGSVTLAFRATDSVSNMADSNDLVLDAGPTLSGGIDPSISTQRFALETASFTYLESNRRIQVSSATGNGGYNARAFRSRNAGKFYFEIEVVALANGVTCGWWRNGATTTGDANGSDNLGASKAFAVIAQTGGWLVGNSFADGILSNSGARTYMFAVDFEAGKVWIGSNGSWQGGGDPAAGTGALATGASLEAGSPAATLRGGFGTADARLRTSASQLLYPLPSGFTTYSTDA